MKMRNDAGKRGFGTVSLRHSIFVNSMISCVIKISIFLDIHKCSGKSWPDEISHNHAHRVL